MEVDVDYVLKHGDPRVETYPLMQSPTKTAVVITLYLIFITVIGPSWMKNKKPFELRTYMLIYNIAMVALSAWMFIRFAVYGWFNNYSWRCESIDYSNNDIPMKMLITCYVYYLSKFIELLDTIFFVLRKKYSQITFLHLFHHAVVPLTAWYGCKYSGGGYATILPMLNVFVHIWMYSYYGLSAMGPSVQKYLWWKKYLTKLQLVQFIIVMTVIGQVMIFPVENCNARHFGLWLVMGQAVVFFILFVHFYITSYKTKAPKRNNEENGNEVNQSNGHHSSSSKTD